MEMREKEKKKIKTCVWAKFEALFGQLVFFTSAIRPDCF